MLKQGLELKQQQKLSPLQIQTIKLIELPVQELEQRIRKELEENPVLDEDASSDKEEDEAPREVSLSEYKEEFKLVGAYPINEQEYNNFSDGYPTYRNISTKSLIGSAVSKEGFVNVYRGTGRILLAPLMMEPTETLENNPNILKGRE